jgi:hypothetical protein
MITDWKKWIKGEIGKGRKGEDLTFRKGEGNKKVKTPWQIW